MRSRVLEVRIHTQGSIPLAQRSSKAGSLFSLPTPITSQVSGTFARLDSEMRLVYKSGTGILWVDTPLVNFGSSYIHSGKITIFGCGAHIQRHITPEGGRQLGLLGHTIMAPSAPSETEFRRVVARCAA